MVQSASHTDDLAMSVAVLGTFQVRRNGIWEQAPTRQVARVGTVLAGWPGEAVERERIMAAVWGDKPPTTATNTLQVHVSHLRRLVGKDAVRSSGTTYLLDLPPEAIDAEQFVEAVHEAARMRRRQHFKRAQELLDLGLGLWHGTPFPDIADPDLEARRARLTELKDQAKEDLLECRLELAADQYALQDVIAEAKELVSRQPMREKGHVLLVRALAAADRPGEASEAFERAQNHTRATVGLDASRSLVAVHTAALHRRDSVYPLAMRSVLVTPNSKKTDPVHQDITRQVRDAVVDLGATLVTVVVDDPTDDTTTQLAGAVARTIAPDMAAGVIVLEGEQATMKGLDDALAKLEDVDGGASRYCTPAPVDRDELLPEHLLALPLRYLPHHSLPGIVGRHRGRAASPSATRRRALSQPVVDDLTRDGVRPADGLHPLVVVGAPDGVLSQGARDVRVPQQVGMPVAVGVLVDVLNAAHGHDRLGRVDVDDPDEVLAPHSAVAGGQVPGVEGLGRGLDQRPQVLAGDPAVRVIRVVTLTQNVTAGAIDGVKPVLGWRDVCACHGYSHR